MGTQKFTALWAQGEDNQQGKDSEWLPRVRRSGTTSPRREASYWVLKNDRENQGETFPAERTGVKACEKVC